MKLVSQHYAVVIRTIHTAPAPAYAVNAYNNSVQNVAIRQALATRKSA